jgi:cytochrome P450
MHCKQLRKGQRVVLLLGAANRDPEKFTDPERLDITRNEGNHLSLGYGAHVCIGAAPTYLEAKIAFSSLLERFPHLHHIANVPAWEPNPVYRGLATFPVRFDRYAQHAPKLAISTKPERMI